MKKKSEIGNEREEVDTEGRFVHAGRHAGL